MKEEFSNQERETIEALQNLQEVPERPQEQIERGKAAFLTQAKQISNQPVSISPLQRLINSFRQPRTNMRFSTLTIAIIFAATLLISFSGSVYAAHFAMPDDMLYSYKLWLEDQRLAFTPGKETQINLHLDYAEERLKEYQALNLDPANPLSDQVLAEFYTHTTDASQLMKTSKTPDNQQARLQELEDQLNQILGDDEQHSGDDAAPPENGSGNENNGENTTPPQNTPTSPTKTPLEDGNSDSEHDLETPEIQNTERPEETQQPEETQTPESTESSGENEKSNDSEESENGSTNSGAETGQISETIES